MNIKLKLIGNIFLTVAIGISIMEFFPTVFSPFIILIGWVGGILYYRILNGNNENSK